MSIAWLPIEIPGQRQTPGEAAGPLTFPTMLAIRGVPRGPFELQAEVPSGVSGVPTGPLISAPGEYRIPGSYGGDAGWLRLVLLSGDPTGLSAQVDG